MSISEKLTAIANNVQKVYEAGKTAAGGIGSYEKGVADERKAFWNAFTDNQKRTDYSYGFYNWRGNAFYPTCDISGTNMSRAFYMFKEIDLIERFKECGVKLDFSKCTSISYCFGSSNIISIPTLELLKLSDLEGIFNNSHKLKTIEKIILKNDGSQTFSDNSFNSSALEEISFEGVIGSDLNFSYSPLLSHDSLNNIINCLKDFRTLGKYDLTNKANDISSQFFYENYSDSFVIRSEDVNDYGEDWLHITAPNGGLLRFYKSAFDESIITLLKKEGTKIELDASYTGDGANYFPCTINKLIITDYAELPEEAHEITPLPDYNNGPYNAETVTENIVQVEETDTAFIVSGESYKSLSFSKDKYSDEIISLLKVGNTISWTSYFPEQSIESITIKNCTIYTKSGFKCLTLGDNLAKLTEEEKRMAIEKGWELK